jgi:hypothetical protein
MRALSVEELGFVSGGTENVLVTGSRGRVGGGAGGAVALQVVTGPALAESFSTVISELAGDVIDGIGNEVSRVINGSDPMGDEILNDAMQGKNGCTLGGSGRTGNWAWRAVKSPTGTYFLFDHLFNGTGEWDRIAFVPKNGSATLTFRPGGFGQSDGWH